MPNCAKMCKSVQICAKPLQNVRNLPSYAQFGTVMHCLTYFGTDIHSSTHFSTLQHTNFSARGLKHFPEIVHFDMGAKGD